MDDIFIFVVGCAVFGLTIGSAFVALLASDHPNERKGQVINSLKSTGESNEQ